MTDKFFVDSNIWLYAFIHGDEGKRTISKRIASSGGSKIALSTQVLNEVSFNLIKKAKVGEDFIRSLIQDMYAQYEVSLITEATMTLASAMRMKYGFSFWDSLIVASALECQCAVLHTEDMQNGQIIENQLKIVNPFMN